MFCDPCSILVDQPLEKELSGSKLTFHSFTGEIFAAFRLPETCPKLYSFLSLCDLKLPNFPTIKRLEISQRPKRPSPHTLYSYTPTTTDLFAPAHFGQFEPGLLDRWEIFWTKPWRISKNRQCSALLFLQRKLMDRKLSDRCKNKRGPLTSGKLER